MKGSKFGPTNFPRRRRGSNPGPLAQEASVLTTRLPRSVFKTVICLQNSPLYGVVKHQTEQNKWSLKEMVVAMGLKPTNVFHLD